MQPRMQGSSWCKHAKGFMSALAGAYPNASRSAPRPQQTRKVDPTHAVPAAMASALLVILHHDDYMVHACY
jgi:hypothetical protein